MNLNDLTLPAATVETPAFLEFLFTSRLERLHHRFSAAMNHEAFVEVASAHNLNLVNPLLLATALALASAGDPVGGRIVQSWFQGDLIENIEEALASFESSLNPSELDAALACEARILDLMCIHALGRISDSEDEMPLSQEGLAERWAALSKLLDHEDHGRVKLIVRDAVWGHANPSLMMTLIDKRARDSYLFKYGFRTNSAHHNIREKVEYELNTAKTLANQQLRANNRLEAKATLAEIAILRKKEARARRFYDWNPCEIDAHFVSASVMSELLKANATASDDATIEPNKGDLNE